MRRNTITLLAVAAVLAVVAGGAAAGAPVADAPELAHADHGPSEETDDEETADDRTPATHPTPTTDTTDSENGSEKQAGICTVGADSPCNGEQWDGDNGTQPDGEPIAGNESDEAKQILIPEDQNRDGEIDDRFQGDDDEAEVGVCMIGVDSPCNGDDVDETPGEQIGDGSGDDQIGDGSDAEEQIWIPEDQNRDGEIDQRFLGSGFVGDLISLAFGLF